MTYSKVHTCAWEAVEGSLKPGDGFHVAEVDVGHARVSLGLMICFDREFPESARILMLGGAELILIPNACDMVRELDGIRLAQLRARAFENMVLLAMATYAAPHTGGCSATVNADGSLALLAGEEEGIYVASFDLDQSRAYRRREVWGNAYRRPELYQALSHGACG
jgi:predicted amidohydrolase